MSPRRPRRKSYALRVVDASTLLLALSAITPPIGDDGRRWRVLCTVCALRAGMAAGRRAKGKCERCDYDGLSCVVGLAG